MDIYAVMGIGLTIVFNSFKIGKAVQAMSCTLAALEKREEQQDKILDALQKLLGDHDKRITILEVKNED